MRISEFRDLKEAEAEGVTDPGVAMYTDPWVLAVFTDPQTELPMLSKGLMLQTRNSIRELKLLEKGMLLEVESFPFVEYDYKLEIGYDWSSHSKESIERAKEPVPDLIFNYRLIKQPHFTPEELAEYIYRFTERAIDLLEMDQKTAEFVRDNQDGVISYLVGKLGSLKFYADYGCTPHCYGSTVIGDFTDPEKPKLLYLVYGLRPLLWVRNKPVPHVYIPWKPCLESSEEA